MLSWTRKEVRQATRHARGLKHVIQETDVKPKIDPPAGDGAPPHSRHAHRPAERRSAWAVEEEGGYVDDGPSSIDMDANGSVDHNDPGPGINGNPDSNWWSRQLVTGGKAIPNFQRDHKKVASWGVAERFTGNGDSIDPALWGQGYATHAGKGYKGALCTETAFTQCKDNPLRFDSVLVKPRLIHVQAKDFTITLKSSLPNDSCE
ncbi:hypothetical protein FRB99_007094 [Tulasnella sp. 403]|nr:hypothetical protein FRB99_007094 [Tulasnella sp. 403]